MELELHQLELPYERLRKRAPGAERALVGSLAEHGKQLPIVVVGEDARFIVIDGYKRVRALKRLSRDTVRATDWQLPEIDALLLERRLRLRGEDALDQAWLLAELQERFGLSLEQLGHRFERSKSWVSRRLGLIQTLPAVIHDQVRALNEDAVALRKLAKNVVRTKNFDTTMSLYGDSDFLIKSQKGDIDLTDVIVMVDLSPSQWQRILPALDASVRRRVERGARLIVINSSKSKISEVATVNLEGNIISILKRIARSLLAKGMKADKKFRTSVENAEVTEEIEKAATLLAEAREPLIVSSPSFFEASANISLLKGKIVAVPLESNAKGISLMGLISEGKSYPDMINGGMKVLYVVGEVPLNQRPNADFLIVQNSHMTSLAKQADVVLPSSAFFEASGTVIDYMGRMKHLHKISDTHGQSMSHRDIFISIARAMGVEIRRPTEDEVRKTARVKLKITFSPWVEKDGFDISPEEFVEAINASVINGSRLLWLKETDQF